VSGVGKPRLVWLRPSQIEVPDVRITAVWDPELLAMFKESIAAMGIRQPIIVVRDAGRYWLVDGKHRLDEAKLQNLRRVPAAVVDGGMRDVLLQNLVLNRLRGRVRPSEMVKVVNELHRRYGMSISEIARRTGLNKGYIDKMVACGTAELEVRAALDRGDIKVGHAYEISRVPNRDSQLRLLEMTLQYRLRVSDLHDVCVETIRLLKEHPPEERALLRRARPPPTADTIMCHFCHRERPMPRVRGFNICMHCFAIAYDEVQRRLKEVELEEERLIERARWAAGREPDRGPPTERGGAH